MGDRVTRAGDRVTRAGMRAHLRGTEAHLRGQGHACRGQRHTCGDRGTPAGDRGREEPAVVCIFSKNSANKQAERSSSSAFLPASTNDMAADQKGHV